MAETYANLEGLQELAQQIQSTFSSRQYSSHKGTALFTEPTTSASLVSVKPENFTGSEEVISSLERAKALTQKSPSIKKSGIGDDLETIIKNFSGANKAIANIGSLLAKLVELYEQTEKSLCNKLDGTEYEYDSNGHRIYQYTPDKKEQTTTPTYVPHPIGENMVASFRNPFVAENGQYGLDICLLEVDARRPTSSGANSGLWEKFGCANILVGVNSVTDDGVRAFGLDAGVTLVAAGFDRGTDGPTSYGFGAGKGFGPSFTFMVLENADGSTAINYGIPGTPLTGTYYENYSLPKNTDYFPPSTPSIRPAY